MSWYSTDELSPFLHSSAQSWVACSIWRNWPTHVLALAVVRARKNAGNAIPSNNATIAITIMISTNVNPFVRFASPFIMLNAFYSCTGNFDSTGL